MKTDEEKHNIISKIRTTTRTKWFGWNREERVIVVDTPIKSRKGIILFGRFFIGFIHFGKSQEKGVAVKDF